MSRKLTILILFTIIISAKSQTDFIGEYHNFFNSKLTLNEDSTYFYTYHFDLSGSWSIGTWTIINDTIILENAAIYDTVKYIDTVWQLNSINVYSTKEIENLILSRDTIPEQLNQTDAVITLISGGGQNRITHPSKFYFKRNRLYEIDSLGGLNNRMIYCTFRKKKFKSYYIKK